ncbi:hypothetical protein D3C80_2134550 [compost metagenome]
MLLDEIHHAIFRHDLNLDFRVGRTKFGANAPHRKLGKQNGCCYTQTSARRHAPFTDRRHGFSHLIQQTFGSEHQHLAGLGKL